ncbi:MAG: hypothetical protein V2G37_03420 [bacterium JZ-2024 1]
MKTPEENLPGKPYRSSPLRWVILAILLSFGSSVFAYWWIQQQIPRLVMLEPDLRIGFLSPFIRVEATFSHPVDRESVEKGVVFQVKKESVWSREMLVAERGKFFWRDSDRKVLFTLNPENYPEVGMTIRVKARNIKAKNGRPLVPSYMEWQIRILSAEEFEDMRLRDLNQIFRNWTGG